MQKVSVGMSGGVDSSVAAALLIKNGYCAIGTTLSLFGDNSRDCSDAAAVCEKLGIEHRVIDFKENFSNIVIGNFISEYACGKTPNPCIICNKEIKFGAMLDYSLGIGCEKTATGHYARIEQCGERFLLKCAADQTKDQSYVLFCLNQHQLSHTLLPLGDLTKAQVRDIAAEMNFVSADRPDSQDICFVPDGDYAAFITSYGKKSFEYGDFIDTSGNKIGTHKGIINYTIGQRKGLGIAMGRPVFVLNKNIYDNTVTIGDEPELFYSRVEVENVNLIPFDELSGDMRVTAKLRYRHSAQPATLHPVENNKLMIEFDEPQRAPSAGQAAVFYDGEYVVGGGIITKGIK